jgi:hypothetical protein
VSRSLLYALLLAAVLALAAATWSEDLGTEALAAFAAGLFAGGFLLAIGWERTRAPPVVFPRYDADPLVVLAGALEGGRFARGAVLARLNGLEPTAGVDPAARLREEEAMLVAPPAEFLRYVEARIAALEAGT